MVCAIGVMAAVCSYRELLCQSLIFISHVVPRNHACSNVAGRYISEAKDVFLWQIRPPIVASHRGYFARYIPLKQESGVFA